MFQKQFKKYSKTTKTIPRQKNYSFFAKLLRVFRTTQKLFPSKVVPETTQHLMRTIRCQRELLNVCSHISSYFPTTHNGLVSKNDVLDMVGVARRDGEQYKELRHALSPGDQSPDSMSPSWGVDSCDSIIYQNPFGEGCRRGAHMTLPRSFSCLLHKETKLRVYTF